MRRLVENDERRGAER
jgi:hypothetical protein